MDNYDLVIIGSGSGNAIPMALSEQWRIAIVERGTFGGTCLNVGCIPSKALLESSERYDQTARHLAEHGISAEEREAAAGYLTGRRPFRRQSPDQVLSRYLTERALGLESGFFDDAIERAAHLPLEEVNAFIRRFYDPAAFGLVRVEPR